MSLYSALYAGVSGLSAQSSAMATVADNITNVNTIGYKGTSAQFQSLVTGGSLTSSYSAGGVSATPKALISKQGLLQASASLTDIGIDGSGFFVVRSSPDADGAIAYTRSGSFTTDPSGYLRNTAGYYLMGWPIDSKGAAINDGSLSALQPIRPNALTGAATPTTSIQIRANLDSTAEVTGYDKTKFLNGTLKPQFSRPVEIYDAQGSSHTLTFNFFKTGANQWKAVVTSEAGDVTQVNDQDVVDGIISERDVSFNTDGSLKLPLDDGTPPMPIPVIPQLTLEYANKAGSVPITFDLGSNNGLTGLTQFGSTSALLSSTIDGGMLGTVASVKISDTGIVSAIFDDGTSRAIYQIPLATFQNPDGLTRISGNAYFVSQESGNVAINAAGVAGSGKISASMLEASNVDLAAEFSNMILFQRAYSASSKIITTVDDMLQEVSNLKR